MRPETKVGIVAKRTCYVSGPVLGLLEWGKWEDRGVGTVESKGDSGRAAGSVLGDRGVERMVGIERDGREGGEIQGWRMGERGSSSLMGRKELGSLAPLPRLLGVQLTPHDAVSLGRGFQGLRTQPRQGRRGGQPGAWVHCSAIGGGEGTGGRESPGRFPSPLPG